MRGQVWTKCAQEKDVGTLGAHEPTPAADGRVRCSCGWLSSGSALRTSWRHFREHWATSQPATYREADPPAVVEQPHLFDATPYDQ
jgi:hypothetical protein